MEGTSLKDVVGRMLVSSVTVALRVGVESGADVNPEITEVDVGAIGIVIALTVVVVGASVADDVR